MTGEMYQVRYQLGGTGKVHRSFWSALRDLRTSRRLARKSGDEQGIMLVKFNALYSDFSNVVPLTDAEKAAVEAV